MLQTIHQLYEKTVQVTYSDRYTNNSFCSVNLPESRLFEGTVCKNDHYLLTLIQKCYFCVVLSND